MAIARALEIEPKVVLGDEPISMLDVSIRLGVLNLIAELEQTRDIGFLYITHELASTRYVADEVLVMVAGRIVEQEPTDDMLHRRLTTTRGCSLGGPRSRLRLHGEAWSGQGDIERFRDNGTPTALLEERPGLRSDGPRPTPARPQHAKKER